MKAAHYLKHGLNRFFQLYEKLSWNHTRFHVIEEDPALKWKAQDMIEELDLDVDRTWMMETFAMIGGSNMEKERRLELVAASAYYDRLIDREMLEQYSDKSKKQIDMLGLARDGYPWLDNAV